MGIRVAKARRLADEAMEGRADDVDSAERVVGWLPFPGVVPDPDTLIKVFASGLGSPRT